MKQIKEINDVRLNDIVVYYNLTPFESSDIGIVVSISKRITGGSKDIEVHFTGEPHHVFYDRECVEEQKYISIYRNLKINYDRIRFYSNLFGWLTIDD